MLRHLKASRPWRLRLVCRTDAAVDRLATEAAQLADVVRLDAIKVADVLRLRRLVKEADAVHLNLAFPSGKYQLVAAVVTELATRPLIVTHHLALDVSGQWKVFMRRLGRVARRHIAISEQQREHLIESFAFPPDRVVTIHNGIDAELFKPIDHPAGAECITVARDSPQKGLDVLRSVESLVPEARFTLITGTLSRPELAARLAAADVFVLPSRYEGGPPLVLMEAMACGLPSVATDVTGVRELITGDDTGRVVPIGDAGAIAAAVRELLGDATLRVAIGRRSRQAVLDGFTLDRSMRATEAVFAEVLGDG